ncbi:hypothetical protein GHN92_03500 [Pseudomonas sp. FSL R10-2964]|nr:hypothetical protein [Pseudomonas sp. FSL R10-2964]
MCLYLRFMVAVRGTPSGVPVSLIPGPRTRAQPPPFIASRQ